MNPQQRAIRQAERLALLVGWLKPCRTYLWIPQVLIDRLRAHPQAIALYVVYVRLWMAWAGAGGVPVSDADLHRFFPDLARGSMLAARRYLLDGGWLIKIRVGNKNTYTPTWGYDKDGQLRLWTRVKGFNRGAAKTVRFNRDILDYHVGRLLPDAALPATIERYIATPLSFRAVGIVALALRSHTITDENAITELEQHRLMAEGELLAARTPTETLAQVERSERGSRRLAQWTLNPDLAPPPPAHGPSAAPQPLSLFFGMGLIMVLLKLLLNQFSMGDGDDAAPEAAISTQPWEDWYPTGMTGMLTLGNPPTTVIEPTTVQVVDHEESDDPFNEKINQGGNPNGSITPPLQSARRGRHNVMSIPNTPTALALRAIHVRPHQICELAAMDIQIVQQVIADAEARPSIRDRAGWTVSVLRDIRDHGWERGALAEQDAPWSVVMAKAEAWMAGGSLPSDDLATPVPDGAATTPEMDAPLDGSDEPLPDASTPAPLGAATMPELNDDARRPDWLPVELWQTLEEAARHALAFAARDRQTISARDVWRQGYLREHPDLVARLLAIPDAETDGL